MKSLVVFAHPGNKGHCTTILEEVRKTLKEKGIEHELIDLYKSQFNPVLSPEEHSPGKKALSAEVKTIQHNISSSQSLIFIYPVWWGSMPAILKGFFDRVFTSGFAFKYDGPIPQKLLTGKRAIIFMTCGAPGILTKMKLANTAAFALKRDILGFCGIKTKIFLLGNARKYDDIQHEKIRNLVEKGISSL